MRGFTHLRENKFFNNNQTWFVFNLIIMSFFILLTGCVGNDTGIPNSPDDLKFYDCWGESSDKLTAINIKQMQVLQGILPNNQWDKQSLYKLDLLADETLTTINEYKQKMLSLDIGPELLPTRDKLIKYQSIQADAQKNVKSAYKSMDSGNVNEAYDYMEKFIEKTREADNYLKEVFMMDPMVQLSLKLQANQ
ncbi:hypothetical protein KHC33_04225 [Methanospirillum sp. J.3.6.1-F.2.7.3]|uniref:Uncharacterized protein n=1 Tax=Methanospirillum purgamenti TaxID=2834276 RepID=A0A8E7EI49_9EURY|nr:MULTISPECIES: hypothetical protein [Methanospirillum]MDX8551900.1 hypothetical protein [Methanospirillum hungatei]QVV89727.1 hypothetical protein KHC33_04225 [Methanospirillum sp. J.3.6.1-F.2.7.3]